MDERGVSEVLAVLLTTVIVVALVAIVAVPALDGIRPEGHQTHITASVTAEDATADGNVTVVNHGGASLPLGEVSVVVTTGTDRGEFTLEDDGDDTDDDGMLGDDGDSWFEEGERWRSDDSLEGFQTGENVRVLVIAEGRVVGSWQGTVRAG